MPLAALKDPYFTGPELLTALCIWREARGEPIEAKLGVAWVIRNRCAMAPREGFSPTPRGNILHPWAFSSFMQGDPNSTLYPGAMDRSWKDSLDAALDTVSPDPTGGAVFYFSTPVLEPPRAWGKVLHTVDIGRLHFYAIDPRTLST